ncbi:hypothetical protein J8273_3203 [Carpediemonas membranifera]|uniref:Uncharacterized protein n=1 Tax=Carpediemonas membranifera TaxID=201153 RepID=A0A8J6B4W7_9EUKA|nr:hypothetical protein J8273_3203 [Carpediemonas membranifera]|eukprot:KAG9393074.1 hypothetical protein J8273_3203 [Carpediemonas membranifera]
MTSIYTVKFSISSILHNRRNVIPFIADFYAGLENKLCSFTKAKYFHTCILSYIAACCHHANLSLPVHDQALHQAIVIVAYRRSGEYRNLAADSLVDRFLGAKKYAAVRQVVTSIAEMPLWHDEFIIRLCTALRAARQQCPREFDVWLGEYATSTKLWLVNALEGYCWRLAKIITRVDTALTQRDPDVPRDDITRLRTEQRALTDMVAAFNTAHPPLPGDKPLAGPKLVPLVPMAPVRPGFMHVPCSLNVLNPAWLAQLGVDPEHHATERMTREQLEALPPNIRRVLSVKTDGVAVDLTVQVGALPYVNRRASGNPTMKRKARERLGVDDADARPAPDPDAQVMGFDPGARALCGFFIRHPDGTTSSGVVPKCGYTKTPSFAFDMTPASFKSTNLDSLQNSIRFVLLHEQEIFDAGMVKSFRRVRLTNHILRQKHFHGAGEQLARTLGWTPRRLPRGIAPPRAAPTRLVVFYGSARFKTPRRVYPCAPYGRFATLLPHIMRAFNILLKGG